MPSYDFDNMRRSNKYAAFWLIGITALFLIGSTLANSLNKTDTMSTDSLPTEQINEEVLGTTDQVAEEPEKPEDPLPIINESTETLDSDIKINNLSDISFKNAFPETILNNLNKITTEDFLDELKAIQF